MKVYIAYKTVKNFDNKNFSEPPRCVLLDVIIGVFVDRKDAEAAPDFKFCVEYDLLGWKRLL
jgi:hypothetical protein